MIILVDYENTHQSGMEGYWYLDSSDTLILYYSDAKSAIPKGCVMSLKNAGVDVKLVRLQAKRDNALDMYIAASTGMYAEKHDKICIVSKDKGYQAVRDFWRMIRGTEILLGETIEMCLLHSTDNNDQRIQLVKDRHQRVNLVDEFTHMETVGGRFFDKNVGRQRRQRKIVEAPQLTARQEMLQPVTPAEGLEEPLIPYQMPAETTEALTAETQITEMVVLLQEESETSPASKAARKSMRSGYSVSALEHAAEIGDESAPAVTEEEIAAAETPEQIPVAKSRRRRKQKTKAVKDGVEAPQQVVLTLESEKVSSLENDEPLDGPAIIMTTDAAETEPSRADNTEERTASDVTAAEEQQSENAPEKKTRRRRKRATQKEEAPGKETSSISEEKAEAVTEKQAELSAEIKTENPADAEEVKPEKPKRRRSPKAKKPVEELV